jgi:hypothetical protein
MKRKETMMKSKDLKDLAKEMPGKIPVEPNMRIAARSRWTCESNWMMGLVVSAGWDLAGRMNIEVGQSLKAKRGS